MTNRIVSHIENKVADNSWTIDDIQQYLSIEIEKLISDKYHYKQGLERANGYNIDKLTPESLKELHRIRKELLSNIQAIETDIKFLRMLSLEAPKRIKKISLHKQFSSIQPIHWLKGEESLRRFIDSLKNAGLIENRETNEIIQEHFLVDFQKQQKEPKPIKWGMNKSDRLLLYFLHKVRDIGLIQYDSMWEIIRSHFVKSNGENFKINQLQSDWSNTGGYNYKPRGHKKIDGILDSIKN